MSLTPINERELIDALGKRHDVAGAQARIVSLVPSITELLFDLGLAPQIVGRTGFCIHPKDRVKRVPKVGGTKSIETARIKRLAPDASDRQHRRESARGGGGAGQVRSARDRHPSAGADGTTCSCTDCSAESSRARSRRRSCAGSFEHGYAETVAAVASWPRQKVLYLIWKSPWMTVASDTYISRMLATVGWDTYEAPGAKRAIPSLNLTPALLEDGSRSCCSRASPTASASGTASRFWTCCRQAAAPASRSSTAAMTSWYGSRAIQGLTYLRDFRRSLG